MIVAATALSDAQRVSAAATSLKAYLADKTYTDPVLQDSGAVTDAQFKNIVDTWFAGFKTSNADLIKTKGTTDATDATKRGDLTYTVAVNADKTPDSTTVNRGQVSATITLKMPETKKTEDGKTVTDEAAVNQAVEVTIDRPFASQALTSDDFGVLEDSGKALQIQQSQTGATEFANDADADAIAKVINAKLKDYAKKNAANAKWYNISASVSNIVKRDAATHDAAGKETVDVTLDDGTSKVTKTYTIALKHAASEKQAELDTQIQAVAKAYNVANIQSASATKAADENAKVVPAIKKIYDDAIDKKVGNTKLSVTDSWKASSASGIKVTTVPADDNSYADFAAGKRFVKDPDKFGPNEVQAVYKYTPATVSSEGEIAITYQYAAADDNDATKGSSVKSTEVKLTLPKLKEAKTTYLKFADEKFDKKFNSALPEKATTYTIKDSSGNVMGSNLTTTSSIYSEYNGKRGYTTTVESENDDADNTYDLSAEDILARNGNDELVWTSSNDNIALVDQKGKVTLKGNGSATITVSVKDNPSVSASIVVNANDTYVFKDVQDSSTYYFAPVYQAYESGFVAGLTKDTFGPSKNVTRAEALTFIWRAAGKPTVSTKAGFTDVKDDAYYAAAVNWAAARKITSGKSATTFAPNDEITRAELVTFLYNAFSNGEKYNVSKEHDFDDVATSAYYYDAVIWAASNGVTAGKTVNTFAPSDNCTRAEAVSMLMRDYNLKQ